MVTVDGPAISIDDEVDEVPVVAISIEDVVESDRCSPAVADSVSGPSSIDVRVLGVLAADEGRVLGDAAAGPESPNPEVVAGARSGFVPDIFTIWVPAIVFVVVFDSALHFSMDFVLTFRVVFIESLLCSVVVDPEVVSSKYSVIAFVTDCSNSGVVPSSSGSVVLQES